MNPQWTTESARLVADEPERIVELFPAAGRAVGREPIDRETDPLGLRFGTADDLAREALVGALLAALPGDRAAAALAELYRFGDDAERRGVLRGVNAQASADAPGPDPGAGTDPAITAVGLELVADALRTNDPRLVAVALGAFAAANLDQHSWRHGVLKAIFMGVPLGAVADLDRRTDAELVRMARALVDERRAAGREISADLARLADPESTTTDPLED